MDKTIAIRIDAAIHRRIKTRLAENGLTLKDYIMSLVASDLKDNKPFNPANLPVEADVTEESVREAQKVLDFVTRIIAAQGVKAESREQK